MQAVRIHTPGPISNLKVERVEIPTPKPDEVLIRNKYAGVNYIDTYHRSGLYPVALPFTLGVDGAGEVYQLGSAVPPELGLTVGTQVAYTAGSTYAEYVAVPANRVAKVPDGIDLGTAAAAMVQGLTALALATQAYPVGQGDWVLVHAAAGGTGQLIVQIAAAAGAHVIGTTSTPEKAELAKSLGAEHVILSSRPDVAEEVLRITGGQGVHVVYDGVGKDTWETSKKSLRHLGTLVTFGNASGKVEPFELATLTPRNIKIMRPSLFEFIKASPTGFADLTSQIFGLIKSGKLKLHVQRVYPLHEAYRAHEDLEGRRTTGKLLLEITPAPTAAA